MVQKIRLPILKKCRKNGRRRGDEGLGVSWEQRLRQTEKRP
jgi:hypothetical protein